MVTWLKTLIAVLLLPILAVLLYLAAALVGGLIPASFNQANTDDQRLEKPVYLVANALHADMAIPVNSLTLHKFEFLRDAGIPMDNPNLEYLIIGWGSKAFYTSTKEYSDMEFATIWQAATGDASVMHVGPAGDLRRVEDLIELEISEDGFARLVDFLRLSFFDENKKPVLVEGASFGYGDVFYLGQGHFHIFNPCNVWVSKALAEAGVASGLWTPTTYSLLLNNYLYN
ncbi:MAG: TIGR02117 family protein [Pseudomonadota bacterium]